MRKRWNIELTGLPGKRSLRRWESGPSVKAAEQSSLMSREWHCLGVRDIGRGGGHPPPPLRPLGHLFERSHKAAAGVHVAQHELVL